MVKGRHAAQSQDWKRYKNRKKTIRDRYGPVNGLGPGLRAARDAELAEARARYREGMLTDSAADWAIAHIRGAAYMALARAGAVSVPDHGAVADGDCCEECIGARGPVCRCACEGANHGAAIGTPLGTRADRAIERIRRAVEAGHRRAAARAAEEAHQAGASGGEIAAELEHWQREERSTPALATPQARPPKRQRRGKPGPKPQPKPHVLTDADRRRIRRRRAERAGR